MIYTLASFPAMNGVVDDISSTNTAWTYIDSDRYMVFYRQTTPSALVAQIVHVGLSGPIYGPSTIIMGGISSTQYIRAFYVGSNKVLVVLVSTSGFSYFFLTINNNDDILNIGEMKKIPTGPNNVSNGAVDICQIDETHLTTRFSNITGSSGSSSTYGYNYWARLWTVDVSTETISDTSGGSFYKSTYASIGSGSMKKILDSATVFFTHYCNQYNGESAAAGFITASGNVSYIYNFNWVTSSSNIEYNLFGKMNDYVPFSTQMLFYPVNAGTRYKEALLTPSKSLSAEFDVASALFDAELVDYAFVGNNQFLCVGLNSDSISVRVFQYIGTQTIATSASTNIDNGLSVITGSRNSFTHYLANPVRHPSLHLPDNQTMVIWFVSNDSISYAIVHQPLV